MTDSESIATLAEALVSELIEAGKTVATAESCTGGWIAKALTDVPGSSAAFGYGFVTYSDAAKRQLIGVPAATLAAHGAVSEETVEAMVRGALEASGADHAVAVSGIAGPDGGTDAKPVGLVWIAYATRGNNEGVTVKTSENRLSGDRAAIRARSVVIALQGLREELRQDR